VIEKYISECLAMLCTAPEPWIRFCGFRLSNCKREFTNQLPTMAVDGVTFYCNPIWPLQRSKSDNLFTLLHEALHLIFRHPERLRDLMKTLPPELVHMAADYAINLRMVQDNCPYTMPEDGLIDHTMVDDAMRALNVEAIIARLLQDQQGNGDNDDNATADNSATNDNGDSDSNGADSDDSTDDSGDSATQSESQNQASDGDSQGSGQNSGDKDQDSEDDGPGNSDTSGKDSDCNRIPDSCGELLPAPVDLDPHESARSMIAAATLAKSTGDGDLPDWLKAEVQSTAQNSEITWLQRLHDRFATIFSARDYSFEMFNEPYLKIGMIEPTLYSEGIGKVAIVGDESGSMSDDELNMVAEQTAALLQEWQPQEVEIIRHTTRIVYTESLQAGEQPTPRNTREHGGTSFNPVTEYCDERACDLIVWVTDCMPCDRPEQPQAPVIFLGTCNWSEQYHRDSIGFGDFIDIR
jgi:predicted metal-dependent peptidase